MDACVRYVGVMHTWRLSHICPVMLFCMLSHHGSILACVRHQGQGGGQQQMGLTCDPWWCQTCWQNALGVVEHETSLPPIVERRWSTNGVPASTLFCIVIYMHLTQVDYFCAFLNKQTYITIEDCFFLIFPYSHLEIWWFLLQLVLSAEPLRRIS